MSFSQQQQFPKIGLLFLVLVGISAIAVQGNDPGEDPKAFCSNRGDPSCKCAEGQHGKYCSPIMDCDRVVDFDMGPMYGVKHTLADMCVEGGICIDAPTSYCYCINQSTDPFCRTNIPSKPHGKTM